MFKNKFFSAFIMLILLVVGFSAVIIADQKGWISISSTQSKKACIHELPSGQCPFCDKSLVENSGLCAEHGVPEVLCATCNPALIAGFKAEGDWCVEHNMPESQCTICHPDLLPSDSEVITTAVDENPDIKILTADDLRTKREPSITCKTETLKVQLRSPEIARATGLAFSRVRSQQVVHAVTSNAEIDYNTSRYANLSPMTSGIVREVYVELGDNAGAGQRLAMIDSPDLGTAKSEYLQARMLKDLREKNLNRERTLLEKRVATEADFLSAEADYTESCIEVSRANQVLRNYGFTNKQIQTIFESQDSTSLLPLTSPFAGCIVEKSVVRGEMAEPGAELFSVADTSSMWAILDVYEKDVNLVEIDQPVIVDVDALPGIQFAGRITWISSGIDPSTRTLKARAELSNPEKLLKAGMFGKARINTEDGKKRLLVPKDALHWDGCCNIVFVKKSDTLFVPRKVLLGFEVGDEFVLENGVKEGEEIVTQGSFLLKTEIMKGSIGAGCCEIDPGKK